MGIQVRPNYVPGHGKIGINVIRQRLGQRSGMALSGSWPSWSMGARRLGSPALGRLSLSELDQSQIIPFAAGPDSDSINHA
jgi:hypothetical protein